MESKVENLEKSRKKLTITVSGKEMATYFDEAYSKLAPSIKIDGFRPGKAPKKLMESAIGINRILSEALDSAIADNYYKVIFEQKITPIAQPNIVINKYPNYSSNPEEITEDFEFEAEVDILPKVELGDYKKLKIEKPEKQKVKEEDVEKVFGQLKKRSSELKEVTRSAKEGDQIEISYEGFIDNVKKDQMCSKNHPLIIGEKTLIPGFEEQLIGLKKDDKKDFKIKFPKDYHSKDFAGKEGEFKVSVGAVREVIEPKLDEQFAKQYGHKTISELKDAIEKSLQDEIEMAYKNELNGKVLEKVLPLLKVELPEELVNRELDRMIGDFQAQVSASGLKFEDYLSGMKKTVDDLKKDMRPQAEKNVKTGLLLGKVVEEKGWKSDDPEVGKKAIDYLVQELTK